ncbi:MAG: hypothetical protein HUU55_12235 [Myxococcales bacterium]|nr:hypothetical protein [Myxococcales bacterium]
MVKSETNHGVQELRALLEATREQIDGAYDIDESGDFDEGQRAQILAELFRLREALLMVPVENIDLELDEAVESAIEDIEDTIEDLDLLEALDAPSLEDPLKADSAWAPSRPVGEAVLERIENFVIRAIPRRELIRAIGEVVIEMTEPGEAGDYTDESLLEDAQALGSDYFLHDWRWLEGQSVFSRFLHGEPNLTDQDRLAVQVLGNSHIDLYRVDDIDLDRSIVSLARLSDGLPLSLEVDEGLLSELSAGDGLLARIYAWSDGPELGECLPVDETTLDILSEWMDELLNTDFGSPKLTSRAALLKAYGYRLAAELLFPSEEAVSTDSGNG